MAKKKIKVKKNDAKLIRLYHYMPAKYAEEFLREDKIKLCDLTKSNDVCEFSPAVRVYSMGETEMQLLMSAISEIELYKKSSPMLVLSGSTRITSSAIWGHYADNSMGICLAFDFPIHNWEFQDGVVMGEVAKVHGVLFHKIHYTDERLIIPALEWANDEGAAPRLLLSAVSYKSVDWAYENECRLVFQIGDSNTPVVSNDGMFFAKGLRKYLTGIIMGAKCDISDTYIYSVLNEIYKKTEDKIIKEILANRSRISRARLDYAKLKISVRGYGDFDFDSIKP